MKKHIWVVYSGFILWGLHYILLLIDVPFIKSIGHILGWALILPVIPLVAIVICWITTSVDKLINPGIPKKNDITKYESIRDQLQTGDVLAFKSGGITGFLIGIVSSYTHVGMVVRFDDLSDGDRVFVLEALDNKGVVLMPLSAKLSQYEGESWWFKLNIPADRDQKTCRETFYQYLMQQLGKNYDYGDIKKIMEKFLKGYYLHSLQDTNRMICSELVARALVNSKLVDIPDCSTITPGDVVKLPVFNDKPQQLL